MDVTRIYPQYVYSDRRQRDLPVALDRRDSTRLDRRDQARFVLDNNIKNDIHSIKGAFNGESGNSTLAGLALSPIAFFRRYDGIKDAFEHREYIKGAGKTLFQYANVKGDLQDIKNAINKPVLPQETQVPFSFTRGTPLDREGRFFDVIKKYDKTLFDTRFGKQVLKLAGIKPQDVSFVKTGQISKSGMEVFAGKINGNFLQKVIGKALLRVPVLSLAFFALLEVPGILTSDNKTKKAKEAAISVGSMTAGGAILGAIGSFAGPLGSLVGLGIGSYLGSKAAKKINNN